MIFSLFRAHERSVVIGHEGVLRVDTCQLAANRPIEDYYSAAKCEFHSFILTWLEALSLVIVLPCLCYVGYM